jgi:hypothetical protein
MFRETLTHFHYQAILYWICACQSATDTGFSPSISILFCQYPRWGRDFLHPSRQALGPTQSPIEWVQGLFPGDKMAGAWC